VGNGESTDLAPEVQRVEIDPLENAVTQALGELQKTGFVLENGDQMR
jgi:hypothetical protein